MKLYRQYLRIGGHVVFWLCTVYMFCHYSYLRPMAHHWQVEALHVFLLALMVYFHYFLLIPYILKRRLHGLYWILTLSIFSLLTIWELSVFSPQLNVIKSQVDPDTYSKYLMGLICNVTLRNAGFWAFFFILKIYEELKFLSLKRETLLLKENHSVSFADNSGNTLMLHIEQMSHIQCDRNICVFYMKNGLKFKQYASLSQWEELLVPQWAIRVNRDTLVMFDAIVSFTDDALCVSSSDQIIAFYKGDRRISVYEELLKRVPERMNMTCGRQENISLSLKNDAEKDEFEEENETTCNAELVMDVEMKLIYKKIAEQPYLNAKALSEILDIPLRTVERKLKFLKEHNAIRYDGSARRGGYVILEAM